MKDKEFFSEFDTDKNSLTHYGRKGMKWYQRIFSDGKEGSRTRKISTKKMSDDEITRRIERLKLEAEYKKLSKSVRSRGKSMVLDILESSGKNIATQLTTYGMGTLINMIFKSKPVNPRKGQKD